LRCARGVSVFAVSRFMGASLAMIDRHYGHLARDSREHVVSLLDALAIEDAVDAGTCARTLMSRAKLVDECPTRDVRDLAKGGPMPGSYEIEWQPGGILWMRRHGFFTVAEAEEYVATAKDAMTKAPPVWGLVVDVREAPPQSKQVQAILQELMKFTVSSGVRHTAIIAERGLANLQVKRLTTERRVYDEAEIAFHASVDDAYAEVRQALA